EAHRHLDRQWMWSLVYGHHHDRSPSHGYEPTREARWRRSPRADAANEARVASRSVILPNRGRVSHEHEIPGMHRGVVRERNRLVVEIEAGMDLPLVGGAY